LFFSDEERCILLSVLKKLAAIFLLALFLVNMTGYNVVYRISEIDADKHAEELLDKQLYNEAELITLKVPLHLQYQNNTSSYERVDGEISFQGKIYKYVKRKIENGNLILLCLPDYNKMRLKKVKEDFAKDANDIAQSPQPKKESNSKENVGKIFQGDFFASQLIYHTNITNDLVNHSPTNRPAILTSFPHSTPEQPPELA
jgi:hypothetical protein